MKTCSKCKSEKPEAEFYLESAATGKRQASCKECHRAKQKIYYAENQQEISVKQKIYCAENKEEIAAYQKIYCAENQEELAAKSKIYREEHREEIAANGKSYRAENREKIAAKNKIYRAQTRKEKADRARLYMYGITPDTFKCMLAEQGGRCAICEKEAKLCVDHDHETGKVRGLLCSACNQGIGQLKDSSDITRRATEYLKNHGK